MARTRTPSALLNLSLDAQRLDQPASAFKSRRHRARELICEYPMCAEGSVTLGPKENNKTSKASP